MTALPSVRPASLALLGALLVGSGCTFPEDVRFACDERQECSQRDPQNRPYVCVGGYCHPPDEVPVADAGTDAGSDAGPDAGPDAGEGEDAGVDDGGSDAGTDGGAEQDAGHPFDYEAHLTFVDQQCAHGFCFGNPRGGGSHLRAVWGQSADRVFIVGDEGTTLYWDGSSLRRVTIHSADLTDVFANDQHVVIAGRGGTLLEWKGGFEPVEAVGLSDFTALTGNGDYLYAVTLASEVMEHSAGGWLQRTRTGNAAAAAWSPAPGQAFVVDPSAGEVVLETGAGDASVKVFDGGTALYAIDGVGDVAIAVGEQGRLLTWDGSSWAERYLDGAERLLSVKVFPDAGVVTVQDAGFLYALDGDAVNVVGTATNEVLRAVWGASPQDVWAVGDHGAVVRNAGGPVFEPPQGFDTPDFIDVWIDPDGTPHALAQGGAVYRPDVGGVWSAVPTQTVFYPLATAVYADAERVFVALSDGNIIRYDAALQNPMSAWNDSSDRAVRDLWGDGTVWYAVAAGGAILKSTDGQTFSIETESCANVATLGGRSAANLWAVGIGGVACRLEGTAWVKHDLHSSVGDLVAVWSDDAAGAVAVSNTGFFAEWTPNRWDWTELNVSPDELPLAVGGTARDALWVFGRSGAVYDVSTFQVGQPRLDAPRVPGQAHLRAAHSTATSVFVVGDHGVILHR